MPFGYTFPFDFDTEDIAIRVAFDSTPFAVTPSWTDIMADVQSGTIRIGRQHELDRIEAGVATLTLFNSDGDYWPSNSSSAYYGNLLPGKRLSIRKTYNATEYDIYTGFIESYKPYFTMRGGYGPRTDITAVDLFKSLALIHFTENVADFDGADYLSVADHADFSIGANSLTIVAWVKVDTLATIQAIVCKYANATNKEYSLYINTDGAPTFQGSSDGAESESNSFTTPGLGGTVTVGTWYHIVGRYNYSTGHVHVFANAVPAPNTSILSGGIYDGTSPVELGRGRRSVSGVTSAPFFLDGNLASVGIWKRALSDSEITTIYSQGRRIAYSDLTSSQKTGLSAWWDLSEASGTRQDSTANNHDLTDNNSVSSANTWISERSDLRIVRVLDSIGWPSAKRDLDTGAATLAAMTSVTDLNALSHLQAIAQSENGLIVIQGDGDFEFQNRTARASSPYDTSQATFGNGAGEMKIHDIEFSYDDTFIYNDVRLTRDTGTEQPAGDVDSQTTYGKRTLSRTGLLNSTDADVLTVAQTLRDKYKTPRLRVESITIRPRSDPANLWPKVLSYGLSTRITIHLTTASAGINDEYHIEGIEHRFQPGLWETQWQLSKAS